MRYLTVTAEYDYCVRDDDSGPLDLADLQLPEAFREEMAAWHTAYQEIILLTEEEREERRDQIDLLDQQGLRLAEQLKDLVPGGAQVKYYSEGRLKYLSF